MKNRFDLEHDIMAAWTIVDDLEIIAEAILEEDLTRDEVANLLIGLQSLSTLKFEKLFRTFNEVIQADVVIAEQDDLGEFDLNMGSFK